MEYTATHIAQILEGTIEGDATVSVHELSKIEEGKEGSLTFLSNNKYKNHLYDTKASIVIVNDDFKPDKPFSATLIRVSDAYQAFTRLLSIFNGKTKTTSAGIDTTAIISEGTSLGENICIGAYTRLGAHSQIGDNTCIHSQVTLGENVSIGKNCTIYSGVRIYNECKIGDNVIIHSNAVIGSDGFGFAPTENGDYHKIPQTGNVIIGDHVEIGSGTIIDRATLGSTKIGNGVKLDNLIQIAHNVEIGENTVIAAQTGIAGSSKIGNNCVIGGQVGIAGHLKIGNGVKIQAQSGIGKNLPDGSIVQGSPAFGYTDWNRSYVIFKNLPAIIRKLENALKNKS